MVRFRPRVALALCLLVGSAASGWAQGAPPGLLHRSGQIHPGQFDFYVLSLSWSPSFCATAAVRAGGQAPSLECGSGGYAFIVHGLWPQFDEGFPQDCQVPAPRLKRSIVLSMLDLMPSPRMIYREWDRHGTCSGLPERDYFDMLRRARAAVTIPPAYLDLHQTLTASPNALGDAFIKVNPGLAAGDIAVECDATRLTEVRICLSKDLKFRACPEIVKQSCRRDQVLMPPPHGHTSAAGGSN